MGTPNARSAGAKRGGPRHNGGVHRRKSSTRMARLGIWVA